MLKYQLLVVIYVLQVKFSCTDFNCLSIASGFFWSQMIQTTVTERVNRLFTLECCLTISVLTYIWWINLNWMHIHSVPSTTCIQISRLPSSVISLRSQSAKLCYFLHRNFPELYINLLSPRDELWQHRIWWYGWQNIYSLFENITPINAS